MHLLACQRVANFDLLQRVGDDLSHKRGCECTFDWPERLSSEVKLVNPDHRTRRRSCPASMRRSELLTQMRSGPERFDADIIIWLWSQRWNNSIFGNV